MQLGGENIIRKERHCREENLDCWEKEIVVQARENVGKMKVCSRKIG
jgi:hypothetical protein